MEDDRARVKEEANRDIDRVIDEALARIGGHGNGDVNVLDSAGEFPLYSAAASGRYDEAKRLLERGANASMRTWYRWTALHWAAANGHAKVVELLLSYNADVNAISDTGKRPLDMAKTDEIRFALMRRGARY
jgi:ankyrin repeat protein